MKIKAFFEEQRNKKYHKIVKQWYTDTKEMRFQTKWLDEMSFGNAEGERDKKLYDSFIETRSIKEILDGGYNYVLAPKGCGKSSLFKAYSERFISNAEIRDDNKTIIIPISNMFAYENIDLEQEQIAKKWAIIWGLYIIKEIFKTITNDRYKYEFEEYIKHSSKYNELKEDFQLYDLWDYLEKVNVGFKFSIKGQEVTLSPTITKNRLEKKVVLNEIFIDLQNYLDKCNKKIYILIDRIDDFIVGESRENKKAFIQGLYYGIEEISTCNNIIPIMFLRTDLYYNLNIDSGIDKIQIRTIELKWKQEELISFIFRRLIGNNQKVLQRYVNILNYYMYNLADEAWKKRGRVDLNKLVDQNTSLFAEIGKKFICTFFPTMVRHHNSENKEEEINFFDWVYRHFEDYTGYINLRYLIVFFNTLLKLQYDTYEKNVGSNNSIECIQYGNELYYPIFSDACINTAYHNVQKIAIMNVRSLLEKDKYKVCFDGIHQMLIQKNGSMNYGDIHYAKYDLSKAEYDTILETLCVLGYLKNSGKKYTVPILYRYSIE